MTKHPVRATLQVKGTRYHAVLYYKGKDGEEKRKWKSLGLDTRFHSRKKAKEKMEELKMQMQGIIDIPGYHISFENYLREWYNKKQGECAPNTFQGIRNQVEHKIIPYFAPLKLALSEVKPKHIRDFYQYLYRQGGRKGEGLSISYIKAFKSELNDAFKKAVVEGLILTNPVETVKLPAKDNPRKPHQVLTQESANYLLGFVQDDPLMFPLLLTTLHYGLRKSEVLGLKWSAVDFEKKQIRIESTIVAGKNPERNKTKTQTSRMTFPMLPDVKKVLLKRKQDQEEQSLTSDSQYESPVYVFTTPNGRYLSPDRVTKEFKKLLSECGLPPMRFHDLRHSTTCIFRDRGMRIKELQQWMRHGKIEMTADVYLHVSEERERRLAEDVSNMLASPCEEDTAPAVWNGIVAQNA